MRSVLGPVRARTTLIATAVVAVVLVTAVAALAMAVERELTARIRAQAGTQVDLVAARLRAGDSPAVALQAGRSTRSDAGIAPAQVEILDDEGHPVVGSGFFSMPGVESVHTGGAPWGTPTVRVGSTDLAVAQRAVEVDGDLLLVVAATPLAEVVHSVRTIIRAASAGVPVVVLLVGAITWTATGRTLRPIERIRTEVDSLSSTTLDRRVPVPRTDDEVARLAQTMNGMLARLETASARQREFVSDAAHELRSPVAAIRAELEVALAHPGASTWDDVAAGVLSETGRLERIVDDLLLLARLDEQTAAPADLVDIGHLVAEVATGVRGPAVRADVPGGLRVRVDVPEDLRVRGDDGELASVLRNLVDNAARHAASQVAISATDHDGTVRIRVDDDGPGIPAADRQRVFERFTRLDRARSRAGGGVGLGLAVVDRVVRSHGGSVGVGDSPSGGARIEVILPGGDDPATPPVRP